MIESIKNTAKKILESRRYEEKKLIKMMEKFPKNARILDIGCGYGRNIELLKKNGFNNITGVEINEYIVENNKKSGIVCFTPDEFLCCFKEKRFDVILMSHIIEHFDHKELKFFLEKYLEFLKKGGSLVIVTPIISKFFYVDFDHVKPYDPVGLRMLFSNNAQLQFYSKFNLKLENIYFRKSPFGLKNFRSLYIKKNTITISNMMPLLINLILVVIFKATFGFFGFISGWIAEYKKY